MLVERIINKIINDNIDIDKLLVVTFTNAAAQEMRERVLEAIYKKLDEECYKKQEVKIGMNNGDEIEILSGLHPGDNVVVKGAYQVKLASATSAIPAHSHEH